MSKSLKKFYNNLGGLNLRSPELLKGDTYATDLRNVEFSENFSITKRRGSQSLIEGFGKCGSVTYNQTDIATGTQTVERLLIDETLRRVITNTVTVTYSGTASPQFNVELSPADGNFYFKLYEDGGVTQEVNLGTGKEDTPITIANMIAEVLTPFSVSVSGVDDIPAAFIKTTSRLNITDNAEYLTTEVVGSPTAPTQFQDLLDSIEDTDFQPMSTVQAHNSLYMTSALTGVWKYDGIQLVRVGLPKAAITSSDEDTGATDKWVYIADFDYTDNKGNLVVSTRSNELTVDSTDTTITIDVSAEDSDGTPFFPDSLSGFDVDNINVNLYRTTSNGTTFYKLDTLPLTIGVATTFTIPATVIDDNTVISSETYVIPFRNATTPPNCRYIDVWRNQIVLTGNPQAVQTVYLANTEDLEGFDFRNSFETSSRLGGANSGIKSLDNFLYVGRPHSISAITGYPDDGTLVVDTLSDEGIGPLSHASMTEANGRIYFTSTRGIYTVAGNTLEYVSDIIQPIFNNISFNEIRCASFHLLYENKIAFLLPVYADVNSVDKAQNYVLVFDMVSNSWSVWDNLDFTSGMNLDQLSVWFVSNESGTYYYNERLDTETSLDYADHNEAISLTYKSHWETAGEPSVPKKYTKLKVFALDTDFRNFGATDFTLDVETNHNFRLDRATGFQIDFGTDNAGWGEGVWDAFSWGESPRLEQVSRLRSARLQSIRIVFLNSTIHENVLISGFELELTTPYVARLRGTK